MDNNILNNNSPEDQNTGSIDLQELLFKVLRNWYLFVLGVAIAYGVAWVKLRYAVPIYSTKSTLMIKDKGSSSGLSEEMIVEELGMGGSKANVTNEIQVLKSRSLMEKVVDSLDLHTSYYLEGRVKDAEMYTASPIRVYYLQGEQPYGHNLRVRSKSPEQFTLLKSEADTMVMDYGVPFAVGKNDFVVEKVRDYAPGTIIRASIRNPQGIAQSYANRLNIQDIRYSHVLTLTLNDPVPQKAIDILNTLVVVYNQSYIEDKNLSGTKTLDFIDERLTFITRELYQVEQEVEGFRKQRDIPINLSEQASRILERMGEQDDQIAELDLRETLLTEIKSFFRADSNRYELLPVASEVLSPVLVSLVQTYNQAILKRRRFAEFANPENPSMARMEEELSQLRANIMLNVRTAERELEQTQQQLEAQQAPIIARIESIPTSQRQLLQIMRQQQIKETLFLFLLQKREETALTLSAQVANSRVLDNAVNAGRISPNSRRMFMMALLLGLAIPGGLVFLRDYLDNKIYTEKDITSRTGAPFLGAVGLSKQEENLIISKGSRSSIAEMFRLLRTNLQFIIPAGEKPRILITSGVSGEGKTFVTVNLGATYALSGKRTLLIGLDLRKPKLARYLQGVSDNSGVGISNFLVGAQPYEGLVQPTEVENLYFIGSGPIPPNPAELLMTPKIQELFSRLDEEFDCILIDSSPVGLVTDALLLAPHINTSIFAVRHGQTPKGALKVIDDIYRDKKLPHPVVLLNGVKSSRRYGYGGYGNYGAGYYGYGYGYGYYEDDRPKKWWRRVLGG